MDGGQKRKSELSDSSSSKRQRSVESSPPNSQGGGFEDELASLEPLDSGEQTSRASPSLKWPRPPVGAFDPAKDSVEFQQLEVDHYIGKLSRR